MSSILIANETSSHMSVLGDYNIDDENYVENAENIVNLNKNLHIYADYDKNALNMNKKQVFIDSSVQTENIICRNLIVYNSFVFGKYLIIFDKHLYIYINESTGLIDPIVITNKNIEYYLLYVLRSNTREIIKMKTDDFGINTNNLTINNLVIDNKNSIFSNNTKQSPVTTMNLNSNNFNYNKRNYKLSKLNLLSDAYNSIKYEFTIYLYINYSPFTCCSSVNSFNFSIELAYPQINMLIIIDKFIVESLETSGVIDNYKLGTNTNCDIYILHNIDYINNTNINFSQMFASVDMGLNSKPVNPVYTNKNLTSGSFEDIMYVFSAKKFSDEFMVENVNDYNTYLVKSFDNGIVMFSYSILNSTDLKTINFTNKYCFTKYVFKITHSCNYTIDFGAENINPDKISEKSRNYTFRYKYNIV